MIATLVAVFVVSGAAGLIYESIWSRYLGLFVGHSAYAQIIVLVIFLGGMSLGAHLAGRLTARLRAPLLWYAGVEMAVGFLGLIFHDSFVAVTGVAYDGIFPVLGLRSLLLVKWLIAAILILPQSILLGATFPLMSAGVIRIARAEEHPGHLLGLLYFANSIGAAVGVLIAGFVLVQTFGYPGTLLVAGVLNVLAACVVGLIGRREQRRAATFAPDGGTPLASASAAPATPAEALGDLHDVLLWIAFGTAVASFVYEIAWIRMLSLVLGSATHSFELMLSAFILGLALGAFWIRTRADRLADPIRFLGIVQWVMGLLAVATLPFYVMSFDWIASILATVQQNDSGYRAFVFARYLICLVIMLPATVCAGMTLPLITRVLMRGGAGERAIGSVYAVNTLGSIVGVIVAGLVLMPVLGLKLLLLFGALVDIGLGVWLVALALRRTPPAASDRTFGGSPLLVPLVVTGVLFVLIAGAARFDLARLTSGVYRHGVVAGPGEYSFPYYRDGRTATVSIRKGLDGFLTLATNGKPDASMERAWLDPKPGVTGQRQLTRDIATQFLLPLITLAHAPNAEQAAVIGFGSGMTSHVLLGSPHVKQLVTVEIEPEMIRASRSFFPANRRVFEDPRSRFIIDDARSYFASSGRVFDLILSEPSNPWVSGVSGLFTQEFYARVKRQLAPRGVFGQWLHLYELSDGLVTAVLAAIDVTFPSYEMFFTSNTDVLIVASNDTLPAPRWDVTAYPGIAADLHSVVPLTPQAFESLRLGGRSVLHPIVLARGSANSDFFPVLDLGAEQMRFLRQSADGYTGLSEGRFDVVAALSGRRRDFATAGTSPTPEIPRPVAQALGARLRGLRQLPPALAAQIPRDDMLRAALYRADALERVIATGRAPIDWHAWMDAVVAVDADMHSGTAGVADTAFFDRLRQFVTRTRGPAEARAGVDFLHGIGTWNWPEVAVTSRMLMASVDPQPWIPDVLLRNGAAVAFVALRDTAGATTVLRTFAKRTNEDQFRERLISSFLIYQDSTMRAKMGWK